MTIPLIAVLGWGLGAAANWLADTLPRARRPERPRCPDCGAPRPTSSWLGIVDRIRNGGRCSYCGSSRGLRPALVEVLSILFSLWLLGRNDSLGALLPGLLVGWVFLLIAVIDIEHRLILQPVVLPAAAALGVLAAIQPERGPLKTALGGLAGFGLLWLMYGLGVLMSRLLARRRGAPLEEVAFGFGDVMLGALIGLVVGWPGVIVAVVFGVLAAGVFSLGFLIVMLLGRRYTPYTPIPYGPFLLLGASVVYFGGRTALEALMGA